MRTTRWTWVVLVCLAIFGLRGGRVCLAGTVALVGPVCVGEEILVVRAGGTLHFLDLAEMNGTSPVQRGSLPPGAAGVNVREKGDLLSVAFQLPHPYSAVTWVKTFPDPVVGPVRILTGPGIFLPVVINQDFYPNGTKKLAGQAFAVYTTLRILPAGTRLAINLQVGAPLLGGFGAGAPSSSVRATGNLLLTLLALLFLVASWAALAGRRLTGLRESPDTLAVEKEELAASLRANPDDREAKRRLGEILTGWGGGAGRA